MSTGGADLIVETSLHPTRWWVLVPITFRDGEIVPFVLDTGSPLSSISQRTRQLLESKGLLEVEGPRRFLLRHLAIQGQPIADLVVRLSARATAVDAAGILGIDFLGRFSDIHFHVPTMRLTLTYPSTAE